MIPRESNLRQHKSKETTLSHGARSRSPARATAAAAEVTAAEAGLISLGSEQNRKSQGSTDSRTGARHGSRRILEQSEHVLAAGTAIATLSNTNKTGNCGRSAVDRRCQNSARVRPSRLKTGVATNLCAPVSGLIEPFGFTKVSALGIEEQRVNVVADFHGSASQPWRRISCRRADHLLGKRRRSESPLQRFVSSGTGLECLRDGIRTGSFTPC